jgi:hypothetical protein
MRRGVAGVLLSAALVAPSSAAMAHHSFAMFDQDQQIELEGTVREFRFSAPHTFIILEVKQNDGSTVAWALEGGAPTALVRDGWSPDSLQPGDEVKMTVAPLRSGAPGGWWITNRTNFRDGKAIGSRL